MLKTRKARLAVVVASAVVVLSALSFLEPAYEKICTYTDHPYHEHCALYNVVSAAFWHIGDGLNYFGPAIAGVATVAVAAFTWILYLATAEQGRLTRQSIDLGNWEFIAARRPRLKIRHITPHFADGKPITVHCTITNTGETNARLIGQDITVAVRPVGGSEMLGTIRLAIRDLAGGQSDIFLTERGTVFSYEDAWNLEHPHGGPALVRGALIYVDDNGVQRRMGFNRQFNWATRRFDLVIPGEDEYED